MKNLLIKYSDLFLAQTLGTTVWTFHIRTSWFVQIVHGCFGSWGVGGVRVFFLIMSRTLS